MKFANLMIDTERESNRMRNYGDDIQIEAIRNLYEYMNIKYSDVIRITIQELFTYDGEEYLIVPISYPLYGTYDKMSAKIIPVYLGLSILSESVIDSLRLREFEPVGCRDQHTFNLIRSAGIKGYLNGCMTLTLPKIEFYRERKKVFIVDVCDELLPFIPSDLKKDAEYRTHLVYHKFVSEKEALSIYDQYKREAKLVITSRLHCAVPCLAYGIPVIYACKTISFRSIWLQKIIPLYDINSFDKINWSPDSLDIEDKKNLILNNASKMIYKKVEECSSFIQISEQYEDNNFGEYEYESMRYPIEYMQNNWDEDKKIDYVIWGITQTSEMLYQYISKRYKNAKLVGIIDLYRKIKFHGIDNSNISHVLKQKNIVIFVTVESANVMATSIFKENNFENYILCWQKQDYKLPKMMGKK